MSILRPSESGDFKMNWLVVLIEALSCIAGVIGLGVAVSKLKALATNPVRDEAWARCATIVLWCVAAAASLSVAVLIGDYGTFVLILVYLMVALLIVLALWLASRVRSAPERARKMSSTSAIERSMVVIQELVPGRVRGFTDDVHVLFSAEEDAQAVGVEGFVKIFALHQIPTLGAGGIAPFLGFWNDAGAAMLLYHDDLVVPKGSP